MFVLPAVELWNAAQWQAVEICRRCADRAHNNAKPCAHNGARCRAVTSSAQRDAIAYRAKSVLRSAEIGLV